MNALADGKKSNVTLAILLMLAFHGVVWGAIIALMYFGYEGWGRLGWIAEFYWGAAFWIVVFQLSFESPFKPSGVALNAADQPALFERVAAIARMLGKRAPDQILLNSDWNLSRTIYKRKRVLEIGATPFQALTVSQLEAQIAHVIARDGASLLARCFRRTSANIWLTSNLFPGMRETIGQFVLAYGRLFWRYSGSTVQARSVAADHAAATLFGSDSFCEGLLTAGRTGLVSAYYFVFDVDVAGEAGFALPVFDGLAAALAAADKAAMERDLEALLAEQEKPGDYYPPPAVRLESVAALPPCSAPDNRPALAILQNPHALQFELAEFLDKERGTRSPAFDKKKRGKTLRRVDGSSTGTEVWIPYWQCLVAHHARHFETLRLDHVFTIASGDGLFNLGLAMAGGLALSPLRPRASAGNYTWTAKYALGAAIACRLYAIGWLPNSIPGSRAFRRGNTVFDPFMFVNDIAAGRLNNEQADELIQTMGLFPSMHLSQLPAAADPQDSSAVSSL